MAGTVGGSGCPLLAFVSGTLRLMLEFNLWISKSVDMGSIDTPPPNSSSSSMKEEMLLNHDLGEAGNWRLPDDVACTFTNSEAVREVAATAPPFTLPSCWFFCPL